MYACMEEAQERGVGTSQVLTGQSAANKDESIEQSQLTGESGLSAVRELALALELVEADDPALWEPV